MTVTEEMLKTQTPPARSTSRSTPLTLEQALARIYVLNWEVVVYLVIFGVAILTRFWNLGAQVMSHDESLHTYYSYELYDRGYFRHTPLMHGPLLFHATAFFYFLFGVNDFSARIYPAILGVAIVMFPFLFRRYLGKWGAIFASIGLLISPMLLFYSRYIRHDIPSIFFSLIIVYSFMQYLDNERPRRPVWVMTMAAALLGLFASKEVSFMYVAIFGSFLTFYWIMRIFQDLGFHDTEEPDTKGEKIRQNIPPNYTYILKPLSAIPNHIIGFIFTIILGLCVAGVVIFFEVLFLRGILELYTISDDKLFGLISINTLFVFSIVSLTTVLFSVAAYLIRLPWIIGDSLTRTKTPFWQLMIGHIGVIGAALLLGYMLGSLLGTLRSPFEKDPPVRFYELGFFAILFLSFESIGILRSFLVGEMRPGMAQMFVNAMAKPRSMMLVIMGGTVLGGVLALWAFNVLDVIRPEQIWIEQPVCETETQQVSFTPQQEQDCPTVIEQDSTALQRMLIWLVVPSFVLITITLLIFFLSPLRYMRLPWQDLFALLLVAVIVFGVLIVMERRSLKGHDFSTGQPVAADPEEEASAADEDINRIWILIVWIAAGGIIAIVVTTRLMTNWWDYLNHQPVFDILIIMGSLVLPWLAAFPLFWMGHSLDNLPYHGPILRDIILITTPFLLVSAAVGFSWNWRVWPLTAAAFTIPFMLFFTTFFTNGDGIGTGLIGSLGYWLEQQGVRRGSQPQYYYTMLQMPVYEFMPMILSSIAAFAGASWIFKQRSEAIAAQNKRRVAFETSQIDLFGENEAPLGADDKTVLDLEVPTPIPPDNGRANIPFMARPYDHQDEVIHRRQNTEYLGSVPFIQFIAYWGLIIVIALTLAGEKMPWLTTHITIPLTLVGGWYVGQVVERLQKAQFHKNYVNWALMLIFIPVFLLAIMRLFLPVLSANHIPFQGNAPLEQEATGRWLAAFIVLVAMGYFIWKYALQIGWVQLRRLAMLSLVLILTFLTARAAWMFAYINYDYATEFGVYAHSGPRVKTVMDIVEEAAIRSPEGKDIRIVYDADSAWPMVWYLRDYPNKGYIPNEGPGSIVDEDTLRDAKIIIVGFNKNNAVAEVLDMNDGDTLDDRYYRFDFIRLWWPMQEYFNLNYDRINNVFQDSGGFPSNQAFRDDFFLEWKTQSYNLQWVRDEFIGYAPAANLYREGMFDIWWNRDYDRYGHAQCVERTYNDCINSQTIQSNRANVLARCIENPQLPTCQSTTEWSETTKQKFVTWQSCKVNPIQSGCNELSFDTEFYEIYDALLTCANNVQTNVIPNCEARNSTQNKRTFAVENWPVSSPLYLYVDKELAAQIWDLGLGGDTVAERLVPPPPDQENLPTVVRDIAGIESIGEGYLSSPRGIDVDDTGNLYVADAVANRVYVFDTDGNLVRTLGGQVQSTDGTIYEELNSPWGVAINPTTGNVYVTDFWFATPDFRGGHRVVVYDPDGNMIDSFGTYGDIDNSSNPASPNAPDVFYGPRDIAIDKDGNIYVADTGNHRVRAYTSDWQYIRDYGGLGTGEGYLQEPVGIAIHPTTGDLYVAETWNHRISVFRQDGQFLRSWDVNMWRQSQASEFLGRPYLVISPDGTLVLVSDPDNKFGNNGPRVVGYDLNGIAVISFNGPVPSFDGANIPMGEVSGLAFGPDNHLYVSDPANNRVVVYPPLPVSGQVQPGINTNYIDPDETNSQADIDTANGYTPEQIGYLYWAALATGDFNLYRSLYCEAAYSSLDSDEAAFNNTTAAPFRNARVSEIFVNIALVNENEATLSWSGFVIFNAGSAQESRTLAETLQEPITIRRLDGQWSICPPPRPIFGQVTKD